MNWQRSMAATVLLILLIVAASFLATSRINQMEENRSFTRLYEETNNLVLKCYTKVVTGVANKI